MKKYFKLLLLLYAIVFSYVGCVTITTDPDTSQDELIDESESENSLPEDSVFSIRFIDVGQADAALVECDGHYMLIDGGNKQDSDIMYTILKENDIDQLDLIVGTHPDEDHIGGLPGALNYATADMTLCSTTTHDTEAFKDFARYANEKGGGITVPSVGDTYSLGSSIITILGVNGGVKSNDTSIILKIQYGDTSFLFTGDAEREAEQAVLDSGADISANVLKVGHHGSADSTSELFLSEIMPQYAIISVGEGNIYGHPTEEALNRLKNANVEVYRTDLQGDISVTSDGKTVTISTEKTAVEGEVTEEKSAAEQLSANMEYVLNTNSKKFHYPNCVSVSEMSEKNKEFYTGARTEIISMGYDPCGNCHP